MMIQKRLVLAAAFLTVTSACERGDPVSVAGNEEGAAQLFTGASTNPSPLLPAGSADVRTNVRVAPGLRDAFGRKAADRRGRYYSTAVVFGGPANMWN
ncbi:MAG: hypothetical protein LC775_08255, partial [Acidobacteria bacterium]|nr:hypothetical protein [Acidobacteriota bacterium]